MKKFIYSLTLCAMAFSFLNANATTPSNYCEPSAMSASSSFDELVKLFKEGPNDDDNAWYDRVASLIQIQGNRTLTDIETYKEDLYAGDMSEMRMGANIDGNLYRYKAIKRKRILLAENQRYAAMAEKEQKAWDEFAKAASDYLLKQVEYDYMDGGSMAPLICAGNFSTMHEARAASFANEKEAVTLATVLATLKNTSTRYARDGQRGSRALRLKRAMNTAQTTMITKLKVWVAVANETEGINAESALGVLNKAF